MDALEVPVDRGKLLFNGKKVWCETTDRYEAIPLSSIKYIGTYYRQIKLWAWLTFLSLIIGLGSVFIDRPDMMFFCVVVAIVLWIFYKLSRVAVIVVGSKPGGEANIIVSARNKDPNHFGDIIIAIEKNLGIR